MINWISTTINHEPRKALGLSCDEYALLDLIFKTQTHPNYSDNGWCAHSYATLADVLGIGKGGVFQMVERLSSAELLEVNPANPKQKRATAKFYSIAYVQKVNDEEKAVQKVNDERSESERNRSESERHIKVKREEKNKHTPREEKISTDWKQVARTMADYARGEGKEDWQYMTAMYNYAGRPEEVMSEWACKATPYQLQTWRDHFPRLLPWVKRAAQSKARQSFRGAPEDAPTPTYTKTKPRPRPEWTPADIEQFRKTFEG